jgi:hypothetical protein
VGGFRAGPHRGRFFLASGIGPNGEGDDTIIAIAPGGGLLSPRLVRDPELSPLDLVIAPNGNILVSSERPFEAERPPTPRESAFLISAALQSTHVQGE